MRVRIRLRVVPAPPDRDIPFAGVFLPAHRCWPARLGSAAIHLLLITVIPSAFQLLSPVPDFEWSRYQVKPIDVRVPLYFAVSSPPPVERAEKKRGGRSTAAEPPETRRSAPPRLELPPLPARKKAETVLLQPNVPMPNIQLSQMPAMAFWARQTPALAPPAVKPFVTPGRAEQPANTAPLDAPPVLAVPNRQSRLSDVNVAALPAAREVALPVQPAATAPVRVPKAFRPPDTQQAGAIDAGQGDPTNIIAFGAVPVPDKIVTVPPVSQAPALGGDAMAKIERTTPPPGPASAEAGKTGKTAITRAGPASKNDQPAKAASGAGGKESGRPGSATSGNAAVDTPGAPQATVEPRQATARSNGLGNGATGTPAALNSAVQQAVLAEAAKTAIPISGGAAGTRLTQPREGRFAFVVTGSSESYPEARGVLAGKIVYSVSVRVGSPKAWVLQYCLPAAVERSLGLRATSVPLEAPYPFVMIRPAINSEIDVRRLVVHGFVNLAGRFEQLSLVSDVDFPEKQALLVSLSQWEFRPASRDGQATAVEVLLIIPREAV
jgi:hypothetical protein